MNVGRDVRIDLADDSAGSYFKRGNVICIIFISSFLSAVFAGCDRSLIREMHCPAWEARSLSPPPPLHHAWRCHTVSGQPWFQSVWRRLRRGLFLWHFVEESRKSESRSLSVAVAYGGRAGLKRIGSLSVLLLIALLSGQRWALWGAACSCLRSSFSAIAAVSKTPCSGSRGETVQFLNGYLMLFRSHFILMCPNNYTEYWVKTSHINYT